MAYKLEIIEKNLGLNFRVKYQNLATLERPDVVAKTPNGNVAKLKQTYQGQILGEGATQRQWVDDSGNVYDKGQLKFYIDNIEREEVKQTKIMEIIGYQPLKNYTDTYVIEKYYELFPDTNEMKKDFDKEVARITNLCVMKKLWDHLKTTQQVARGEFIVANSGFYVSDGYIRAVEINNKWGLEVGIFKQAKQFEHLNDNIPIVAPAPQVNVAKKLKMI